ncbi:cell wall-binding repeat-containing protein [Salinibacterium sp. SWN248]|uniref:cell wall-binding repeat-containing protein n=1 Tax=Salinibacterium sp. SWN248 TaxID=2792056 RepID=UPI0018CE16C9|nr:cell wall-binding repeat-containing protein [Salinibacterium sp. SWN248]MBH0022630.1 cell wall-binding repeat-containing protein [Salinibacterium sp. SWN248]
MLLTHKFPPAQKRFDSVAAHTKKPLAVASTMLLAIGISVTSAIPATASPAPAGTTEVCSAVTQGPVATNQISQGWTFADTRATGHNDFTAAGLHVWTEGAISSDKAAAYKSVDIALTDVGIPALHLGATTGTQPSLQLITDFNNDGTADGILVGEPAAYPGGGYWVPNSAATFVKDAAPSHAGGHGSANHGTLDEWLVPFPDARVLQIGYSLGSGVHGDAIIESVEVGCVNYAFGIDDAYAATTTVQVTDVDIAPFEDSNPVSPTYNYDTWHEGYNNATRAYSTEADGLHFGDPTPSQVMLGTPGAVSAVELEALLTSASITALNGNVTFQVPVTYGTNNTFTTLRSEFLAVGAESHFSVSDNWNSSKPFKNNNGTTYTPSNAPTIADIVAFMGAQGNITLLGFGVQASHAAIVQDLVFNDTKYTFAPTGLEATTKHVYVLENEIALFEDSDPASSGYNYTDWHEGYNNATQSFSVENDALKLGDPSHSQALKGLETPLDGSELYTQLTEHAAITVDSGTVTYQVAFTHDGPIGWGTLRSTSLSAGTHTFSLSDSWVSSKAIGSSISANTMYPLGDILDALIEQGDAKAAGFGVQADHAAQISSITWGDTEYTFGPKPPPVVPTVTRLAGSNRYETAARIAQEWTSASVVYIATGRGFADALSAGPAATFNNAPLLLTDPNSLSSATKAELVRLQPSQIIIVGGSGAVSDAVKAKIGILSFASTVTRIGGIDRFETSRMLAEATFPAGTVNSAYVANGYNFPDALTASPAAGAFNGPVLLIRGSASTVDSTTLALLHTLGVDTVKIAGGGGVVTDSIVTHLGTEFPDVTRNGDANRYSTAVAINVDQFTSVSTVYLATGGNFADALAGASLAGSQNAPLFLSRANCIPHYVMTAITDLGATNVVLLGGTGVLGSGVANLTVCS